MVVIAKIMIATDRDRDSLRFDLPVRRSTRTPSRRSLSVSRHCSLHRRTATATANSPPLDYKDSSHIATQSERAAEFPFSISGRPLWRGAAARQLRAARRRGSAAGAPARRRGEARYGARRPGGAAPSGRATLRRADEPVPLRPQPQPLPLGHMSGVERHRARARRTSNREVKSE